MALMMVFFGTTSFAEEVKCPQSGVLTAPVRMDLTANGKVIGFVMIPAGTKVLITEVTQNGYLAKRSVADTTFPVSKDSIAPDAPTATPTPSPTATPTPSPSPVPAASFTPAPSATPTARAQAQAVSAVSSATNSPTANQVNKALGIPLFGEGSLWEENDAMVASRIQWPQESKTVYETGYRRYPYTFNSETRILGARSLSLFLQGINNKVSRVAILFANKGDVAFYSSAREAQQQAEHPEQVLNVTDNMLAACHQAMRLDKGKIDAALTSLFGESQPVRVGKFAMTTEAGQRWDWRGSSFLLFAPLNEYVALRIVPTKTLDDPAAETKSFADAKTSLPKRVEHRDNGDVIITDLPMVDQGRKGYCVPATFERVLRYYGLSEDMNILAMAGQTSAGGVSGTSISKIESSTYSMLRDAGANITEKSFNGNISDIKSSIDGGKPVLFPLYSTPEFNRRVDQRMRHRIAVTDWKDWEEKFLPDLKKSAPLKPDPSYSHICLIIGYNPRTREIAISDSWGPTSTERWMTEEEARQVKQGGISIIE